MSLFAGRSGSRGAPTKPSAPIAIPNTTNSSGGGAFAAPSGGTSGAGQQLVERLSDVSADSLEKARQIVATMRTGGPDGGPPDANGSYLLCFQLLKLAGLEAEIPRLVVFGQQSMGKTTLLGELLVLLVHLQVKLLVLAELVGVYGQLSSHLWVPGRFGLSIGSVYMSNNRISGIRECGIWLLYGANTCRLHHGGAYRLQQH